MRFDFLRLLLVAAGIAFAVIMLPFWKAIFWGITISIIFYPVEKFLYVRLRNRNLSSFITVFLAIVIVAIPVTFAVIIMVNEAEKFISNIGVIKSAFSSVVVKIHEWSKVKYLAPWVNKIDETIFSLIKHAGMVFTNNLGAIFSGTYSIIVGFVFAFIVAFFLLRDGDKFIEYIGNMVDDKETFNRVLLSIRESIMATVLGGILTALIQGFVGAVGFLIVGLNAFFLWMFLIALFSFLPLIGTAVVWVPAAIYLFVIGKYVGGIFLLGWGVFAIGLVDNYVRPFIISTRINIHPMLLFFGILGAIAVFGPVGIVAGPVIVSIADAVARSFVESRDKSKI